MRKVLLLILLAFTGLSFTQQASATQYYLSPSGSDSNAGTSTGSPWLTPNHALTCGTDAIQAAAGSYSSANFQTFGTVTCAGGNNVVWLSCVTFDACKISATTQDAMQIQKSYWGIEGWETTTSSDIYAACYRVTSTSGVVHHVIFANNIANSCMGGGFNSYATSTANSVDYITYIGNIAYNAAQGTGACYSGFNVYEPIASDTNSGTHIFEAGNFAWANKDGSPCSGSSTTDGEGINNDTWDMSQTGGSPYTQQGYVWNNISFLNGGYGIEQENNKAGGSSYAHVYIEGNTQYGNRRDTNQTYCSGNGDLYIYGAYGVTATDNLIYTGQATDCSGDALYAMAVASSNSSTTVSGNYASGVSGNNTYTDGAGGFTFGTNVLGTNPNFANPVNPGAPSCGSFASVPACMATVISNFVPSASGASAYGYQTPSNTSVVNALFPQWLCSGTALIAGIPSGLVTPGCGVPSGTYTVPSATQASLVSTIATAHSAGANKTVLIPGGFSIPLTSTVTLPCDNGLTVTGPAVAPNSVTVGGYYYPQVYQNQTAIVKAASIETSFPLFSVSGCTGGFTLSYIHFENAQALSIDNPGTGSNWCPSATPGCNFNFNYVTSLPSNYNQFGSAAVILNADVVGPTGSVWNNLNILHNYFGDATSCLTPNDAMNLYFDSNYGGQCTAFWGAAQANHINISYNNTYHLEQGFKWVCNDNQCSPDSAHGGNLSPGTASQAMLVQNFTFQNNDILTWHRIGFEMQFQPTGPNQAGVTLAHNSLHDAYLPYFGTMGFSDPCCNLGGWGLTVYDNALIENVRASGTTAPVAAPFGNANNSSGNPAYADEWWGGSSVANANWLEGFWCCGVAWGFGQGQNYTGGPNWIIENNYICGSYGGGTPDTTNTNLNNGFITNEENSQQYGFKTPSLANNQQSSTCAAQTSVAPTIASTGSGPFTVTLTDTSPNTFIYYTTDGSTPTVASALYSAPFSVASGTTVNALGMWGAPNQPTTYAAGYGFTPSAVVSQHFSGGTTPTLTGVSLTLQPGGSSVQVGKSVQACANMSYSGGISTQVCGSGTDTYGTTPGTWASSVPADASVNASGVVAGLAAGTTSLSVHAGSFTSAAFPLTVTAAAPTLTGVTISMGGTSTLAVGQTAQATAQALYTGGITTSCTATADTYGTTCAGWLSGTPATATISSTGLVSAAAVGGTSLSVVATGSGANAGKTFTSAGLPITVTSATPPAATLTGVSLACGSATSVQVGGTLTCSATCAYSDSSTTNCSTTDAHGTLAYGWSSTVPADATVSSSGVVTGVAAGSTALTVKAGTSPVYTSTAVTVNVTAVPSYTVLGNNQFNTTATTAQNYINSVYAVTGTQSGGYTVSTCNFYLPSGTTYATGSRWDCGLIRAPTSSTQSASWLCHATYTTLGTAADVGWHSIAISGCGTLPVSTAYWVAVITNETSPATPGQGFWNCGGSCTGAVPTVGNGTWSYSYISATYGVYSGMQTAMNHTSGSGTLLQPSQYVTLGAPAPTLSGGYLSATGNASTLAVGQTLQFRAYCSYNDGTSYLCDSISGPSPYGDHLTSWSSSSNTDLPIGQIGGPHPGLASALAPGTGVTIQGLINTTVHTNYWGMTVTAATVTAASPTGPRQLR